VSPDRAYQPIDSGGHLRGPNILCIAQAFMVPGIARSFCLETFWEQVILRSAAPAPFKFLIRQEVCEQITFEGIFAAVPVRPEAILDGMASPFLMGWHPHS